MTDDVIDRAAKDIEETEDAAEEESALDRMDHASEPGEDDVASDARANTHEGRADALADGRAKTREDVANAAHERLADDRDISDRAAQNIEDENIEEESALDRMDRESEPGEDDVRDRADDDRPQ